MACFYPERIHCNGTTITFYQAFTEKYSYKTSKTKKDTKLTHRKYIELTQMK